MSAVARGQRAAAKKVADKTCDTNLYASLGSGVVPDRPMKIFVTHEEVSGRV